MGNQKLPAIPVQFRSALLTLQFLAPVASLVAGELLPSLKVGSEVYSNVTVTGVTTTDIYFSHARGMGNAKLKHLGAAEQKRFRFDAAKSGEVEQQQVEATRLYHQRIAATKSETTAGDKLPPITDDGGDLVVTQLYARSFRGQRPPQIIVQEWLTPAPDVKGKFVLVEFWATWCGPCRQSVPHLNALQAKFKDRLVVIGLSDEPGDEIKKMASPRVSYYVGTDPQARTRAAMEVQGIPHAMLMDPQGIVRFEGQPDFLEAEALERLMAKYAK